MYHVELRQFPHNLWRFNLTEQELRAIALPWARGDWLDLGERKWSPHQAKLTILEGERLPVQQLSIGRGWRNARRQSEDVTSRVLTAAKEAPPAREPHDATAGTVGAATGVGQARAADQTGGPLEGARDPGPSARAHEGSADGQLVIDSLGPELVRLLAADSARLSLAWRAAIEDSPERSASACLARAEEAADSPKRR